MTAAGRVVPVLALLLVLLPGLASEPLAHPLATTEVKLDLRDPTRVTVRINANAASLTAKLTAMDAGGSAAGLRDVERIRAGAGVLAAHAAVMDGGMLLPLTVDRITVPEPERVEVHLSAPRPTPGSVQWKTTLVYGSYPLVVWQAGQLDPVTEWVSGGSWSAGYASGVAQSWLVRAGEAARMGFTHILPAGIDHVLFVLGLFLLAPRLRTVLAQVTAFTVAHSVTLGLTLYGVVSAPASVVEPLIALSIAYVAVENLLTSTLKPWRLALVFGFGLLHGLGFAEALARLELPRSALLTTLVSFNVGVEAGQLTVLALAALTVALLRLDPVTYRRWIVRPASAAIGIAGAMWTVERLLS